MHSRRGYWALLASAAVVAQAGFASWLQAYYYDAFWADGPFQVLNILRRIREGELPFRDFPVFHGVAMPFSLYPIYRMAGATLFSAELSRQLLPRLTFLLGNLLVLRALGLSWTRATLLACIYSTAFVLAGGSELGRTAGRLLGLHGADPENSMRGLRAGLPIVTGACVTLAASLWGRTHALRIALLAGGLVGLCLTWSFEQGLAASVGMMVWLVAQTSFTRESCFTLARQVCVFVLAFALVAVVSLSVFTGGHPFEALRYGLGVIPKEQFWYFGVPPNPFVSDWRLFFTWPVLRELSVAVGLGLAIFAFCWVLWRKGQVSRPALGLFGFLFVYSCVASASILAIVAPEYFGTVLRVLVLATVWLLSLGYDALREHLPGADGSRSGRVHSRLAAGTTLLVIGSLVLASTKAHSQRSSAWRAAGAKRIDKVGTEVLPHLFEVEAIAQDIRAATPASGAPSVWSTYAGILEALLETKHPAGVDYVIHALGPAEWERYLGRFDQLDPQFFVGLRPPSFSYEEWLWVSNWELYRRVLERYEPSRLGIMYALWRRSESVPLEPEAACEQLSSPSGTDFVLPAALRGAGILEVTVEYETRNRLSRIPLLGLTPRYFVNPIGFRNRLPVSLPPGRKSHIFPVFPQSSRDEPPRLTLSTVSLLPGADLRVRALKVCPIQVPMRRLEALTDGWAAP